MKTWRVVIVKRKTITSLVEATSRERAMELATAQAMGRTSGSVFVTEREEVVAHSAITELVPETDGGA